MTNSRNKGAQGERELAALLEAELGIRFQRNLEQCRDEAQGDLIADDPGFPFVIEVKRRKKGWICEPAWEKQARAAAEKALRHPCIAYRFDGQKWRFRVYGEAIAEALGAKTGPDLHADLDLHGFCFIAREIMAWRAT